MAEFMSRWGVRASFALLLVVLGGRLWLVDRAGSDLPLWDQWWVDFGTIVVPLSEGTWKFSDLAETHNEHHLFFQRLNTIALMGVSGRWEPREGLVLSAFMRAIDLVVVFLALGRGQPLPVRGVLLLLLAGLGALPIGVFNLLSAFQALFFSGEALTLVSLALLFQGRLTLERVGGAISLLLLALLDMATPLITAVGAVAVLCLRLALKRGDLSRNVAAAATLSVFAFFTFVTTPRASYLQATNVSEFLHVLMRLAAWPFPETPALGLLALGLPLLLLRRLIVDPHMPGSSWFVFALSVTSWLQNAAIAFARARSGQTDFPQYIDGLWLGHLVGFLVLVEALRPAPGESSRFQTRACALWAAWLLVGLITDASVRGGPGVESVRQAVAIRQPMFAKALQSGELSVFAAETQRVDQMLGDKTYTFFDHPVGRFALPGRFYLRLADRKDREKVLRFLPAALVGARPSRLSRGLNAMAGSSPLLLGLGLLLLVWSLREAFAGAATSPGGSREQSPKVGEALG